jgi:HK97 family phage portal protein
MLDASPHAPPRGWLSRALARFTPAPLPETKASRTGPLIALEGLREPVWSPRDYATFAREGMMQNAIVYRAVRMVAEAAASVPLLLYDGDVEIETHPLLDLLARPNPVSTRPDLLEAWYGALLVSGNAYLEAVATGGEIRELHALRADRMKVIPGPDGWPEGYEYTANGESIRFTADVVEGVRPILHLKFFHPANDHYGLSPLEAAATAIDIHNTASRWNKALLDNSARPSGALVYTARDGNLSPDQFERLKSELEAGFQGAAHAGRPLLLEGGLDWKSMSLSPKDMDFIEAKHVAAREIALALGVPPMLLGIPGDNTYSNYQEATRTLWRQTVLPLVTRTAKALSAWLSPAWNEHLDLRPDLDAIDALSSERDALWSRLEKTTFLTADEKRAAIGYAPLDAAGRKYRPDQARDDAGRWTDEGGGDEDAGREITFTIGTGTARPHAQEPGAAHDEENASDPASLLVPTAKRGGFAKEVLNYTVRKFVSSYCKGSINRELPGQFEDLTISDVLDLAKGGDRAAKTCAKLLREPRFRK